MLIKADSLEKFEATLSMLTQALVENKVIRDDLSVHKKGGKLWTIWGLFCRIFLCDVDKHYRAKVVVPSVVNFCRANLEFATYASTQQAICKMLKSFQTTLSKNGQHSQHVAALENQIKEMETNTGDEPELTQKELFSAYQPSEQAQWEEAKAKMERDLIEARRVASESHSSPSKKTNGL